MVKTADTDISHVEHFAKYCQSLSVPVWVAPLLQAASRLKTDKARRKKAYKLVQYKLFHHKLGCPPGQQGRPTYVYPPELKQLVRTVFPEDVCDYPDPSDREVVVVTLEDLNDVLA